MTATTYYAVRADEQLAEAQRTLDTHVAPGTTGRLLGARVVRPLLQTGNHHGDLHPVIAVVSLLPGATRSELLGGASGQSRQGWAPPVRPEMTTGRVGRICSRVPAG